MWQNPEIDGAARIDIARLFRLQCTADALAEVNLDTGESNGTAHAYLERVEALAETVLDSLDSTRQVELRRLLVAEGADVIVGQPEDARPWLGVLRGYPRGCVGELTSAAPWCSDATAYGKTKARAKNGQQLDSAGGKHK